MNNLSAFVNPSSQEQGLGLCRLKAAWTAKTCRVRIASQQSGHNERQSCKEISSDLRRAGLRRCKNSKFFLRPGTIKKTPTAKETTIAIHSQPFTLYKPISHRRGFKSNVSIFLGLGLWVQLRHSSGMREHEFGPVRAKGIWQGAVPVGFAALHPRLFTFIRFADVFF